jgi:hypothetical protein
MGCYKDGCASSLGRGGGSDAFVKEEGVPSLLSFKGGRGGAVSKASSLTRLFKMPITLYATHDLRTASSRQPWSCHVSAISASSHCPLTACRGDDYQGRPRAEPSAG